MGQGHAGARSAQGQPEQAMTGANETTAAKRIIGVILKQHLRNKLETVSEWLRSSN